MYLSEGEIYQRGKIKDIVLILDDGDTHDQVNHWQNTTGKRMYALDRVEIAEALIDNERDGIYYHHDAELINNMKRPITKPFIIFNYQSMALRIRHLFEKEERPYRVNYPTSFDNFVKQRRSDTVKDLINISNFAFPDKNITDENELNQILDQLVEPALKLFPSPWPNAIARFPILRSNHFSTKSQRSAIKILKIISLLKNHIIDTRHVCKESSDIIDIITAYPSIRIDHKIQDPI